MNTLLSYREAMVVQALRCCTGRRADAILRFAAFMLQCEQFEREAQAFLTGSLQRPITERGNEQ